MSEKENNSLTRKTYYENPLRTIAGYWEEPGPRFVDPYAAEERKAIQEVEREAKDATKAIQQKAKNDGRAFNWQDGRSGSYCPLFQRRENGHE